MVVVPSFLGVTTPSEETVATAVLDEDQVTLLSLALDGVTVAVRVTGVPTYIFALVLSSVTPVTWTVGFISTESIATLPAVRFFPEGTVISRVSVLALPTAVIVSFVPATCAGRQANQMSDVLLVFAVTDVPVPVAVAVIVPKS